MQYAISIGIEYGYFFTNHHFSCFIAICYTWLVLYSAETLTLAKASALKLQRIQCKMEISMLEISLRDRVRNEEIRRQTVLNDVEHALRLKWKWVGHVVR